MGLGYQIDSLPHKTDKCNSRQALKVFKQEDGSVNGFCYSCGTFVPHPYGEGFDTSKIPEKKVKTLEEIAEELEEISTYKVIDVPTRKLRKSSLEKFGVKVAVSERDGTTPFALYFPMKRKGQITGYHVKMIDPPEGWTKAYNIGDSKDIDLLNWDNAKKSGAWKLIITEGPEDMVSVDRIFEMYDRSDGKFLPAVVSLPWGVSSAKRFLSKHATEIKQLFKEVILSFDDDEPGHKAVKEAALILPEAKSVTLPYKDANACVVEGAAKAAYEVLSFRATTPKTTSLVKGGSVHELAKQPAKFGELTWPWGKLNQDMRGIRLGETTYIGAGTKVGKSTVKNALAAHFMKEDGVKVFMACPEEPNEMSYKLLANQLTGKIFHDPDIPFDYKAFDEAGEILKDNLYMINLYQFLGWEGLKVDIRMAVEEGCKVVMIDPITNLTAGVNAADTNTILAQFAAELSAMSRDLGFHALLFAHLKAGEGFLSEEKRQSFYNTGQYRDLGPISHEFGGSVYSYQFTGSRAMQRSCNLMLGMLGNKDPDLDEEIRNTRELIILEDRAWGNSAKYPLFYNKNTGQFTEL